MPIDAPVCDAPMFIPTGPRGVFTTIPALAPVDEVTLVESPACAVPTDIEVDTLALGPTLTLDATGAATAYDPPPLT